MKKIDSHFFLDSDKEEFVEKKNEPLLTFEELPEIKIEISKCGHIIGPNVNDEVAKVTKYLYFCYIIFIIF